MPWFFRYGHASKTQCAVSVALLLNCQGHIDYDYDPYMCQGP